MKENFERVQREQRQQIDDLNKKLDALTKQQTAEVEKKKLEEELSAQLAATSHPFPPKPLPATTATPWVPTHHNHCSRRSAYMNISFDALMDVGGPLLRSLPSPRTGDHDPIKRGFSMRNAEIAVDARWTLTSKALAISCLSSIRITKPASARGDLLQSIALPANLQVKAAILRKFRPPNPQHPISGLLSMHP